MDTSQPYILRLVIAAGFLMLWVACGGDEPPEPPLPVDIAGTDPAIIKLFEEKAATVRGHARDPSSWKSLGMVYQAHGRLELALECYRQSLKLAPTDARSHYFLALTEERLGRIDDAIAHLRRVAELDAGYAPTHWRLGLLLLDIGDLDGARRSVEQALTREPTDRAATLAMARVQLQASHPAQAAQLLEKHLGEQPEDGYAHFLLGRAYRRLGRDADAVRETTLGRGSEPRWRDPWADEVDAERTGFPAARDAAVALLGAEPESAVSELERLRSQAPENVGLLINLGIGYRRSGRLEDSAAALQEALRLQPARPLAHLHLAVTYGAIGRGGGGEPLFARALAAAERTIELRPDSAKGHAVRADLLIAAGRPGEAIAAFVKAADLDPDDPQWLYHAASLLSRQGRWRQAMPLLERCLDRAPENVDALFLLGASQANTGQLNAARVTLERARELAPEDPNVAQALEQLRRTRTGK